MIENLLLVTLFLVVFFVITFALSDVSQYYQD